MMQQPLPIGPGVYVVRVEHAEDGTITQRFTPCPDDPAPTLQDELRAHRRVATFRAVADALQDGLSLTRREASLAAVLYVNAPAATDRQTIRAAVHGPRAIGSREDPDCWLRQLMSRLRTKLGAGAVATNYAEGYRLTPEGVELCRMALSRIAA
ncbi:helix-turn-helix domain-containing protein [Caulobacter endophyticus]|uniref:OmpR/PhoB-type domain-containing protein n=1 Tax=Caulobacter endophyticus TaxID=2172652 RepID=A0A2T9K3U6_9CAUL|nr:helix-turn-helix domain-containing protein [Caulobacter endophyticus]PVM90652.1 hypothetical protein DDF67_09480 [Caulobacter endophyticus]